MAQNPFLLGIDIGTSSLKCVVFNHACEEIAVSHRTPEILRKHQNFSELSMEKLWMQVFSLIEEVIQKNPSIKENITAIGISGTASGSWLLDSDGRPTRDAILWNDGRCADIIGEWQQSGVLDEIFRISGNAIFPGYPIAILKWLQENEPESLKKAKYNIFCKDWIRYQLTGELAVDHSDMGYFPYDIRKREISTELLQICGIEEAERLIPEIIEPDSIAGYLKPELSKKLGLPPHIPVVVGFVDVAATTLGGGAYATGHACSIVGTSFLNTLVCQSPSFSPFGIGVQTSSIAETFIRSMVNTSGTINLQWFLDIFCEHEKSALERENKSIYTWAEETAKAIKIGSNGLMYHPYINTAGVISPFVNPTARAQFFGVSADHTKAHFLRAIYEGTALSMLDCYEHIPESSNQVFLSGGGTRSDFWCQMFADCTGKEILVTKGNELGARGVALLAGCATGLYRDINHAAEKVFVIDKRFVPDMKNHRTYLELYQLYKDIYTHLSDDWWHRHNITKCI